MPCRVGITTDLVARRISWQGKVVGFKNWRLLRIFSSRKAAQEYENSYAAKYGCKASPGGADTPGRWYVYRFDCIREK